MPKLLVPRDHVKGFPATEAAYLAIAEARARRTGREVTDDDRVLYAYVSNGAWMADCPHCNNGIAVNPEWTVAPCLGTGCLRVYRDVFFPEAWRDIEAVLDQRPLANRNWFCSSARTRARGSLLVLPDESLDDLVAENLARGLRTGLEAR